MIVRPDQLEAIRAGKKTRIRFWVAKGERECTLKPNRVYGVRSSWNEPANLHVTVTQVRREPLGQATHRDAKREGHRTVQELHAEWDRELDREMWVILFVLGDQTDRPRLLRASAPRVPTCTARIKQADGRWKTCGRGFADEQSVCRCGARRPAESVDDHGYTTRTATALRGEPEAIPDTTQKAQTAKAHKLYEESRRESWGEQRDRLLAVIQEIRESPASRSVNESLRGVERQVASLDRKLKAS
jgi:hypothetical protein